MRSYESEDIISIKSVLSRGENVLISHKELKIESLNKLATQQVLYLHIWNNWKIGCAFQR